jgi:excinuclease UvrABC helicase subunit UvrB
MGKDDPKEMLKVVYAVLADKKDDIERLFFPIVGSSVASLEQEFKYQQSKSSSTKTEVTKEPVSGEKTLSDLQEELDDAEDSEDYEKAVEIRDEIKRRFPNK